MALLSLKSWAHTAADPPLTPSISLLLHSLLHPQFPHLQIHGLDVSPTAVSLARENLTRNVTAGHLQASAALDHATHAAQVQFSIADIFETRQTPLQSPHVDILISNPPYVSTEQYNTSTTRSVRNFEPRRALVPSPPLKCSHSTSALQHSDGPDEDAFYTRLLVLYARFDAKVLVMEVGDAAQAWRVAGTSLRMNSLLGEHRLEIWRDDPESDGRPFVVEERDERKICVRGSGNVRAVVLFRECRSVPGESR